MTRFDFIIDACERNIKRLKIVFDLTDICKNSDVLKDKIFSILSFCIR